MTKEITPARLASLLAALSAIGPFAIDAYLPAFPAIRAELGASPLEVQQTLTIYMGALALMVLWHGALADRFGRRRVLIALTAVFALASLVCALAPTIECLWLGRALQGVSGGAGVVVGRAVVRDLHEGRLRVAVRSGGRRDDDRFDGFRAPRRVLVTAAHRRLRLRADVRRGSAQRRPVGPA